MSWILMVAFGFGAMFTMKVTPPRVDAVLIRVAALSFAGAGTIGATGWIGSMISAITDFVINLTDKLGNATVGESIVWIIAAGLGALWVGSLLPARLVRYDFPDWLSFTGFLLPSLLATVPGQAGEVLRMIVNTCSEWLVKLVGSWF